jgi:hypothetical protein
LIRRIIRWRDRRSLRWFSRDYGHVMAIYVAANIAVIVIATGLIYASRGRVA